MVVKSKNYILALILTILIFFSGLYLGTQLTSFQIKKIEAEQKDLATYLSSLELRYTLLEENICDFTNLNEIGEELDNLGGELVTRESKHAKEDGELLQLKEPYFLLEIRHYLLLKEIQKKCGRDFDLIIYFYSNDRRECSDCEQQGFILSYLQKKSGYDKVKIYSFDARSQSPAIKTLMKINNVNSVPTIIINDVKYEGFLALEEIENLTSFNYNVSAIYSGSI